MTSLEPDAAANVASHLLIGATATTLIGKRAGAAPALVVALFAVVAHQALDAPLAKLLSRAGL